MPKRGKGGKKKGKKKGGGAPKGRDGSPERIEQRAREMMAEGCRQSGDNSWFTVFEPKVGSSPFIDWEHLSRWGGRQQGVFCNHGCPKLPAQGHGVSLFLDNWMLMLSSNPTQFVGTYPKTWQMMMTTSRMMDHGGVWSIKGHREMATKILLAMATNIILRGESPGLAGVLAIHALYLEEHDGGCGGWMPALLGAVFASQKDISATVSRLTDGNQNDVIDYLASKTGCNCLYEKC